MKYRRLRVFGGKGSAPHQFTSFLRGITVSSADRVFVVGDSEVKIFDNQGSLADRWTTSSPGWSIAVDDQTTYVGQEGQLEFYTHSGELTDTWRDPERLGLVSAIGLLDDFLVVADSRDRCLRRYDRQGQFLNNIGKDNRMRGFNIPNGILDFAIDNKGIIHACNPGKHRVERYTPEGELLGRIGRFDGRNPEGFPGCCNPTNVAVTDPGYTYVTEKAGPRAKVYDNDGSLLAVIATDVFDPNCKNMDLTVDSQGRVYVLDTVQLKIHVFVEEEASGQSMLVMEGDQP
jgi:hypothetical protein